MAKGGYSSEIREEMISHDDAIKAQKKYCILEQPDYIGLCYRNCDLFLPASQT